MQSKIKQSLPGLRLTSTLMMSALLALTIGVSSIAMAASSREEAAAEAMMLHGQAGKVLSIRDKKGEQGSWYEVKILTDGNVSVYRIQQD